VVTAMAARAQQADLDPQDKARKQLISLQQRLEKTRSKLAECREQEEQEKVIEALESTVSRLDEKVREAQQQLDSMETS